MPESLKGRKNFPDWWKYLPVEPGFGSLIDWYGGRKNPSLGEVSSSLEVYDGGIAENTSRGVVIVERTDKNETRVIAEDLGIALLYNREGKLKTAVVDLLTYFSNVGDKELDLVGGEEMIDLMQDLDADNRDLNIIFNLEEKFILVVNADGRTVTKEYFVTDLDYHQGERLEIGYGGHQLNLVSQNREDVFFFGMKVTRPEEMDQDVRSITKVLSDCNIRTFLESHYPDKIDRLARRIFL